MNIDEWRSQIKRGTLEFAILLMISRKEHYGYEIISALEQWPILTAKESTIYPLLRRLLKEELLTSYWQETQRGLPPRKYYRITDRGRGYLDSMRGEWDNLLAAIDGMGRDCPESEKKPEADEGLKRDVVLKMEEGREAGNG